MPFHVDYDPVIDSPGDHLDPMEIQFINTYQISPLQPAAPKFGIKIYNAPQDQQNLIPVVVVHIHGVIQKRRDRFAFTLNLRIQGCKFSLRVLSHFTISNTFNTLCYIIHFQHNIDYLCTTTQYQTNF